MKKLTIESAKSRLERKRSRTLTTQIESQNKTIEFLQADNKSISDAAPQLKNMIETFIANIPSMQAEAAKAAIYALFESGNCHQHENGAGDGYIESGDALKFADKYAEQILKPSDVTGKCSELAVQQGDYIRHLESERAALSTQVESLLDDRKEFVKKEFQLLKEVERLEIELKKRDEQNAALAAQVEALKQSVISARARGNLLHNITMQILQGAELNGSDWDYISESQVAEIERHLAEIRAQAVTDFLHVLYYAPSSPVIPKTALGVSQWWEKFESTKHQGGAK